MFNDMSDEEYARLLGLMRGAQGGDHRFPPGAYERDNMVATGISEASTSNASLSAPVKVKSTTLEGDSATDRMRIGTISLPENLLERIRLVLKGTFSDHYHRA